MARELNETCLEDSNGYINVTRYLRDLFEKDIDCICDNCKCKRTHRHVYEISNGRHINICYSCNKKINNPNGKNLKFIK